MKEIEKLEAFCQLRGWEGRKYRDKIIEELVGITWEQAKTAETINRYLRWIYPSDEIGIKKESEYHMPEYLRATHQH